MVPSLCRGAALTRAFPRPQNMDERNLRNPKYRSIPQALATVVREEGVAGLYKGNGANVLRVIPVYALKFSFNDTFKDLVRGRKGGGALSVQQMMYAGTAAGLFQQLITYPLEVVRTRLSLGAAFSARYSGIVGCAVDSVRQEGVSALYKGIGPTLLSGAPYVGIQMTVYEQLKMVVPKNEEGEATVTGKLCGGAVSGVLAQTVTYPGDTIRRRMQTNGLGGVKKLYRSSWHCTRMIVAHEGFLGLFQGLSTNIVRCLPGAAIQFVAYERLKEMFRV